MNYNKEIFGLFTKVAKSKGLPDEFLSELLKDLRSNLPSSASNIEVSISVEGLDYQLNFDTTKPGKIFELKGMNTRYKTTTLILIGVLFGCDWESQVKFMNNFKLESQIEEIENILINPDIKVILNIKSDLFDLKYEKQNSLIRVFDKNVLLIERKLKNVESDLREYQLEASSLFKVQFISKGRDFVTQVHNEILMEIKNSIDYISNKGQNMINVGLSQRPSPKVYTKTLREYENELVLLTSLKKVILEFYTSYPFMSNLTLLDDYNELSNYEKMLQGLLEKKECTEKEIQEQRAVYDKLIKEIGFDIVANDTKYLEAWTEPIENLNVLLSITDKMFGKDLVPFSVELLDSSPKKVSNKEELLSFLDELVNEQTNSVVYFKHQMAFKNAIRLDGNIKLFIKNLEKVNQDIVRCISSIEKLKNIKIDEDVQIPNILSKISGIKLLMKNLGIGHITEISEIINEIELRYEKVVKIIIELKKPKDNKDYLPYEILFSIIEDFKSVKSFLDEKGKAQILDSSSSIRTTAEESQIYFDVVNLFNELMRNRCKYYYKATEETVESIELKEYNFENRLLTTQEGEKISARYGLSGGVDSAMTVRSLASCSSDARYGTVILVDEWGDVSDKLAHEVYDTLLELNEMSFCLFVKVAEEAQANIYTVC